MPSVRTGRNTLPRTLGLTHLKTLAMTRAVVIKAEHLNHIASIGSILVRNVWPHDDELAERNELRTKSSKFLGNPGGGGWLGGRDSRRFGFASHRVIENIEICSRTPQVALLTRARLFSGDTFG